MHIFLFYAYIILQGYPTTLVVSDSQTGNKRATCQNVHFCCFEMSAIGFYISSVTCLYRDTFTCVNNIKDGTY